MNISYDNSDNNSIPEFKIIESAFGNSYECELCNDELISSEETSNCPILKKQAIEDLKLSDTTENSSSDTFTLFERKFSDTYTLKDSDETNASLPEEESSLSSIPAVVKCIESNNLIYPLIPLPVNELKCKIEEELKLDDSIINETDSFKQRDRSVHTYDLDIRMVEESKNSDLNEESKECFTLEKSNLKYFTKSPIEMYEHLEKNEKVICMKEDHTITKLSCLREKATSKFICFSCAIKNEMKCNEFEDWCDFSKNEKSGFKICTACRYFKPLFAYIKRSNESGECKEIKTCLFCRNMKRVKKGNNKTSEPFKLPPIYPSINKPIIKPFFDKPPALKEVKDDVIEDEINKYLKNSKEKLECHKCKEIIFAVDGFKKGDDFFCKKCLILIKNDDKEFKICNYADPIYECHDYDDNSEKRLIYCSRCRKYKSIASFLKGDEKEIKMLKNYCKSCALKRNICR